MWSDNESKSDYLNFDETAGQVARILRDPKLLPVAVGIFGGWGAGKSTMLNLTEAALLAQRPPEGTEQFLVVRFDAWLFQSYEDARTALTETLARELLKAAKDNASVISKVGSILKRARWLKILATTTDVGIALATGVPVPLMGAIQAATALATGAGTADDAKTVKEGAEKIKEAAPGYLKPETGRSVPEEIAAMRAEFNALLDELKVILVVFIDNLDRCLPTRAIDTLEAIRLVLFLPRTAFVIAADEDMVRHAVRKHYEGPMEKHVKDYLDKLIQVPVRVPLPGVLEVQSYISLLLLETSGADAAQQQAARGACEAHLQTAWKQTTRLRESIETAVSNLSGPQRNDLVLAERLAPLLAQSPEVLGNPRIVKRLFNTIRLRSELASSRSMPLDEPVLAKLAIFERCTTDDAYTHLCALISQSPDGKVELLRTLETAGATPATAEQLPELWRPVSAFILEWLKLPPTLSSVDLRGALYLSRSSFALRIAPNGLEEPEQAALEALRLASSVNSPAAKKSAEGLQPRQAQRVMDELIGMLRKHDDWQQMPACIYGCVILADAQPATAPPLAAHLKALPDQPKWLTPMAGKKPWWKAS